MSGLYFHFLQDISYEAVGRNVKRWDYLDHIISYSKPLWSVNSRPTQWRHWRCDVTMSCEAMFCRHIIFSLKSWLAHFQHSGGFPGGAGWESSLPLSEHLPSLPSEQLLPLPEPLRLVSLREPREAREQPRRGSSQPHPSTREEYSSAEWNDNGPKHRRYELTEQISKFVNLSSVSNSALSAQNVYFPFDFLAKYSPLLLCTAQTLVSLGKPPSHPYTGAHVAPPHVGGVGLVPLAPVAPLHHHEVHPVHPVHHEVHPVVHHEVHHHPVHPFLDYISNLIYSPYPNEPASSGSRADAGPRQESELYFYLKICVLTVADVAMAMAMRLKMS